MGQPYKPEEISFYQITKQSLGDTPFVATTLCWIATSYHELGDYYNAIIFASQALDIRETLLGRHQETVRSHYDLGEAFSGKKDFKR